MKVIDNTILREAFWSNGSWNFAKECKKSEEGERHMNFEGKKRAVNNAKGKEKKKEKEEGNKGKNKRKRK